MAKPNTVSLKTDLSPEECLRRLRQAADPSKFAVFSRSGYKGSKPVMAKLGGTKIKLWKRQRGRNSFARFFWGAVVPDTDGSRIEGHFGMDPFVKLFMVFWLASILFGVFSALIAMPSGANHGRGWAAVVVLAGLIVLGALLLKIGQWMTRSEENYLREFLQATLVDSARRRRILSFRSRHRKQTPLAVHAYAALSKIPAAPIPPPMHIVTSP